MPLITPPIKNIKEVTEPLKEEILNGNVHTIDEMKAWLQPLGYSETINEVAIILFSLKFIMREISTDNGEQGYGCCMSVSAVGSHKGVYSANHFHEIFRSS